MTTTQTTTPEDTMATTTRITRMIAQPTADITAATCLSCGYGGEREIEIGTSEHTTQHAHDACPRCGSHDARPE